MSSELVRISYETKLVTVENLKMVIEMGEPIK